MINWNAKNISLLTNNPIHEESKYPTLDVLTIIRKRRADWLRISFTNDPNEPITKSLHYQNLNRKPGDIFSDFEHKSHDTWWWNFWKEKIGKKSYFQKSYTSNIIIWTNSMDLCVFLNKMAFEIWHVSWLMCWTSLNYTPKRTTSHWWRTQAYSSSSKKHSGLTGSIRRSR